MHDHTTHLHTEAQRTIDSLTAQLGDANDRIDDLTAQLGDANGQVTRLENDVVAEQRRSNEVVDALKDIQRIVKQVI